MTKFKFTFSCLESYYRRVADLGYKFVTCAEYVTNKNVFRNERVVVHRIDVDFSMHRILPLLEIYSALGIKGSFFIRLHAPEYNPFSFENYLVIKRLLAEGHELGYHSEVVDQAAIWSEDSEKCLKRDIDVMSAMFDTRIAGVASHGGMTGLNNLDFWKDRKPSDFGLLYEAYDKQPGFNLFDESFYISDSEWTRWKCYNRGTLVPNDHRNFADHAADGHPLIYLLIHSDTYYQKHFYETPLH